MALYNQDASDCTFSFNSKNSPCDLYYFFRIFKFTSRKLEKAKLPCCFVVFGVGLNIVLTKD